MATFSDNNVMKSKYVSANKALGIEIGILGCRNLIF